jgi:hypothetical protein
MLMVGISNIRLVVRYTVRQLAGIKVVNTASIAMHTDTLFNKSRKLSRRLGDGRGLLSTGLGFFDFSLFCIN